MSSAMRPKPSLLLERLDEPQTIGDAERNIEKVIEWSVHANSNIGYFAVLYKRVTIAIRDAINNGEFEDGPRMERLDVAFARRYFNALNAYFYPDEYEGLTLPWEVAFVGDQNDQATMLQHMLTGLNAHITFDLGLVTYEIAPTSLDGLENDFNRVNALLCSQIPGMLDAVEQLSPAVRQIRWLLPSEVVVLKRMLTKLRRSAWYFAIFTALHPDDARQKRVNQASWTAALGAWYLHPPGRLTPFPVLVRAIAKRESRDVGKNIQALEALTDTPVAVSKAFL